MLSKKSPRGSCGIGKRNNRIGRTGSLNQRCALAPDLESILRGRTRKILFRQHRPITDSCTAAVSITRIAISFDHLVGTQQESFRDRQSERLGGSEVDDEFELGRLLDRNVA